MITMNDYEWMIIPKKAETIPKNTDLQQTLDSDWMI
jgi:hypothetical protein